MKNKRRISMIIMSLLLAAMLTFSVSAAVVQALATGFGATASVTQNTEKYSFYISTYIANALDAERNEYSGCDENRWVSVHDGLLDQDGGPAQASRSYASCNGVVEEDYWTD